jgi:aminoglycoside phosphotransferase (APT) family kinase protein
MPACVWTDVTLIAAARLLRSYHDAQSGFEPPADAHWRVAPGAPSRGPIICHNDIAPYNTVFVNEQPIALIDWDFAAPGSALWDVAYALWFYVPLTDDPNVPTLDKPRRLRLFCDTYGLYAEDLAQVLATIRRRQEVAYDTLRVWGSAGVPGFAEMWRTGHAETKLRDIATLERDWNTFAAALVG